MCCSGGSALSSRDEERESVSCSRRSTYPPKSWFALPADHCADAALVLTECVLAEGFSPKAVAMAVLGLAVEADVSAAGDKLFNCAQVRPQFEVSGNAQDPVFKSGSEKVGQLLF